MVVNIPLPAFMLTAAYKNHRAHDLPWYRILLSGYVPTIYFDTQITAVSAYCDHQRDKATRLFSLSRLSGRTLAMTRTYHISSHIAAPCPTMYRDQKLTSFSSRSIDHREGRQAVHSRPSTGNRRARCHIALSRESVFQSS